MAECMTPFSVSNKTPGGPKTVPVPCGHCPNCLARRVSHWSFRLLQEEKRCTSAWFVTLTYDTEHVPFSQNRFMTLRKRDLQTFFKRLRYYDSINRNKGLVSGPIKYYAAGEYGGKGRRPHYHIILFNAHWSDIDKAWPCGHVHYGSVGGASVGYTLKYISKRWRPLHRNDDRVPQFALMSKGIGDNYLTDSIHRWHHADLANRMYCNVDGKKISMPRYYKERIYTKEERSIAGHFSRMKMVEEKEKRIVEYQGNYERDQIEMHKAAFARMNKKANERQKL